MALFVRWLLVCLASIATTVTYSQVTTQVTTALSAEEIAEGWILLFDGHSLFGWKSESEADWQVKEGAVSATQGAPGLLRTTSQFDDYELQLEFRATAQTNSGVFLRTSPQPKSPTDGCYEVNIVNRGAHQFTSGSLVARAPAIWELELTEPPQWHVLRLRVLGDRISGSIDGRDVVDYTDPDPLGRGYIGLQYNGGQIEFRNIKLKPLQMQTLFDGKDLSNWSVEQIGDAKVEITSNRELLLRGGRGQLESRMTWQDFIVSIDCRTESPQLNSGLFFRCIPGQMLNGYESQIHNGMIDNDPEKPIDTGTGGIFRRTTARKIVANDQEWFRKTLVVTGPHISVWVNGYQVTDWTDTRADHENPRNGRRLSAGTLALQGHDETTNISFRNIQAKELAPRRR